MKIKFIFFSLVISLFNFGCKEKQTKDIDDGNETIELRKRDVLNDNLEEDEVIHDANEIQWGYEGATGSSHWTELFEDSDCGGIEQSPINIISGDAKADHTRSTLKLEYSGKTKIHDVTNAAHTIQFNTEAGNAIIYNNETYHLIQFEFHSPSEHTLNGVQFPLETQLLHQNDQGQFLEISILSEVGKLSLPLKTLENYFPTEKGTTILLDIVFDVTPLLPQNRAYYSYLGSLTSPPCTENVQWIILKSPTTISGEQLKKLQEYMPSNNFRNLQSLNGRVISSSL